MRARLVVFPIKGRNWCFSRSVDAASVAESSSPPPALKDLWAKISLPGRPTLKRAEFVADFVADRMNRSWIGLEKAPPGSVKSKLHSLGLRLLSRVKPSEIFLKSVSKDIERIEITYPASLNPRFVRRRLRYIAMRGCTIHKKYLYGSVSLIPVASLLGILPMPNIPFFWVLFRTYSHWRALQGSQRLMLLVSDCSKSWDELIEGARDTTQKDASKRDALACPWALHPSEDLERLLDGEKGKDNGLGCSIISRICKEYNLEEKHLLKYRDSL